MLFLVKIRWNLERAKELTEKINSGEIKDISLLKVESYSSTNDPTIGFDIYEAIDEFDLRKKWLEYEDYGEMLEINPVKKASEIIDY